jgi:hypothetical protein
MPNAADVAARLRCGTVHVPRDYADPGSGTFALSVVIAKSAQQHRGKCSGRMHQSTAGLLPDNDAGPSPGWVQDARAGAVILLGEATPRSDPRRR